MQELEEWKIFSIFWKNSKINYRSKNHVLKEFIFNIILMNNYLSLEE